MPIEARKHKPFPAQHNLGQPQGDYTSQPAAEDPTIAVAAATIKAASEEAEASNVAQMADTLSQRPMEASQSTPIIRYSSALQDIIRHHEYSTAVKSTSTNKATSMTSLNAMKTVSAGPPLTEGAADSEVTPWITETAITRAMVKAICITSKKTADAAATATLVTCRSSTKTLMSIAFGVSTSQLERHSSHLEFVLQVEKALKIYRGISVTVLSVSMLFTVAIIQVGHVWSAPFLASMVTVAMSLPSTVLIHIIHEKFMDMDDKKVEYPLTFALFFTILWHILTEIALLTEAHTIDTLVYPLSILSYPLMSIQHL
ncbi:hypothetical protein BDR07DRAFT_1386561 [Suillus spraguei]|nr:hypothetical protein BDR07DRAFT_1386561 [Suillus spraguei]